MNTKVKFGIAITERAAHEILRTRQIWQNKSQRIEELVWKGLEAEKRIEMPLQQSSVPGRSVSASKEEVWVNEEYVLPNGSVWSIGRQFFSLRAGDQLVGLEMGRVVEVEEEER